MSSLGILAYGSLIKNPGSEIKPLIIDRIPTLTPFPVEFARISLSRGGAPTVVPWPKGNTVNAEILALREDVSLDLAKDLLWRRETWQKGTSKKYPAGKSPNSVVVKDSPGLGGLDLVLYTDFHEEGKQSLTPEELAQAAVASVAKAAPGKDGISYLKQLISSGIKTPLTDMYLSEILILTKSATLDEALYKSNQ